MKIIEQVKNSFYEFDFNVVFSRDDIVQRVVLKYQANKKSIIPSDYCYNRTNKDIQNHFETQLHIFEFLGNGKYKYLGENYSYEGNIYHFPKGKAEQIVGKWENSKPKFF